MPSGRCQLAWSRPQRRRVRRPLSGHAPGSLLRRPATAMRVDPPRQRLPWVAGLGRLQTIPRRRHGTSRIFYTPPGARPRQRQVPPHSGPWCSAASGPVCPQKEPLKHWEARDSVSAGVKVWLCQRSVLVTRQPLVFFDTFRSTMGQARPQKVRGRHQTHTTPKVVGGPNKGQPRPVDRIRNGTWR